jgi:hypothetical protein
MAIILDGDAGITQEGKFNSNSTFGLRNRIFNGDMRIAQRGTSFAGLTDGGSKYTIDRWRWNESGTSTAVQTVSQEASAPTGFVNSLKVETTTAQSPLNATNSYRMFQVIEGNNISDLAWGTAGAKPITISFWVRSSITGTFGGSITNTTGDRYYVYSYSIAAANTWEYKTITVAGDTSGTWLTDNGVGLFLNFSFGTGSTYLTTPGSWGSTRVDAPTGQVNVAGTLNATFYITGVQLEAGSVATPFERRPFGTELALCQRYYYKLQASTIADKLGIGFNRNTTSSELIVFFPTTMRTSPTALEQSGTAGDYSIRHQTTNTTCSSVPVYGGATLNTADTVFTVSSGLTAGQGSAARAVNTNAYLAWSAEL